MICRLGQAITGDPVDIAYVDQRYTGARAANAAAAHGIRLEVIKLPEAKWGFVLLPRRWVVERSIAGASEGCAWRAPVAWSRFALKVSAAFKELP